MKKLPAQHWTNIRGTTTTRIASVTQATDYWLDLSGYENHVVWVDLTEPDPTPSPRSTRTATRRS